jgi:hypothetical protein
MYRNFNITEEERQQIMEMHKSHGYKQLLNEAAAPNWDKVTSYLLINKFPPNYTSKVESFDNARGGIWHVDVYNSQGGEISFFDGGDVTVKKKGDSRGYTLLGIWTWDGTKPVIPSMDITNSTKAAAGFAKNQDDILKNNKILGVGSRNDLVKIVQEELYSYYFDEIKNTKSLPNPGCTLDADENPICDGVYGQKTKQLVLKYQEDEGLKKDGFVGNETYRSLRGFRIRKNPLPK